MTTDPQTVRYRHRTTEVEAVQWTGSNADQLRAFCGRDFDGMDPMEPGDWVVKADEDFLVFSPVDFATYYEPAPAVAAPAETALRDRIAALAEDLRYVLDYRGPRHAHERPGVWDTSGKPCDHCARLAVVRKNLDAYDADPDAVLAVLPTADLPAEEAYRLAVSAALRLGTGATWEAIRDRAEDLAAEVEQLTEAGRRLLEQRQEMAAERFAWQERGDRAEARVRQLEAAASVDRARILNEAADHLARQAADASPSARDVILADVAVLRRLADETQPAAAAAHRPHHRWYVETRDDLANQWAPGMRFTDRAEAAERYRGVSQGYPTWKDGAPVQRRFVRETTSYTVEAEPAAAEQQPKEA